MSYIRSLYYGDCLQVLARLPEKSTDLIYLDPPFNSNRDYNTFFTPAHDSSASAQVTAFEDSWHWGEQAQEEFGALLQNSSGGGKIFNIINSLKGFLGETDMMAYLVMMSSRLVELHRVLKDTGSLYLHCDPTASHYLKIVLDGIFEPANFRNEIVWKRTSSHSDSSNKFSRIHDIILFYSKTQNSIWNKIFVEYDDEYKKRFKYQDSRGVYTDGDISAKGLSGGGYSYEFNGVKGYWRCPLETMQRLADEDRLYYTKKGGIRIKRYLHELPGVACGDVWTDIFPINSQSQERLGYPTQKPAALLERIIQASSNPGDVVLDPFCGCGTAVHAAEKLGRQWIGIDITHLAITLISQRMKSAFPDCDFTVTGSPQDVASARYLAENNGLQGRYQFQFWALSLVDALPGRQNKKGPDGGIDGVIWAYDTPDARGKPFKIIVSVKSGKIPANHIRELRGLIEASRDRDNTQMALLLTLQRPSKKMVTEALTAGKYAYPGGQLSFPRIQILTIEDLLAGKRPDFIDYGDRRSMNKQARREQKKPAGLGSLLDLQ